MKKILIILINFILLFKLNAQKFEVSFSSSLIDGNFSGNVLLYLSKEDKNPKDAFLMLELSPVYRVEVKDLKANEKVLFDDSAINYPVELTNIERGDYYVQAVFDRNLGGRSIAKSPGNIYSKPIKVNLDKNFNTIFRIVCDEVIKDIAFKEGKYLKELKIRSKLLSDFNKKDVYIGGAVSLPKEYYTNPKDSYPIIFSVFGFGADYRKHSGKGKYKFNNLSQKPVIVVYLDGNCPQGHSTYANSDINGPWGDALVKEFIPELEKSYRTNKAFFLFGHSSGGWTVLWLQINYPDTFSGAWSSAPDQVDFRNWQNDNIYEAKNMFYDANGNLLSDITIAGTIPVISAKDMYRIENVVYRGEQLRSFDAVFSTFGDKGEIIRLVDPKTGNLNKESLKYFRRYDISYQLRNNWEKYKDGIEGKIRISIGRQDNFYLHEAVYLFENEMNKLNADIDIEYFSGDHFTVFSKDYQDKGQEFLNKCYNKWIENNL